MPVRRRSPRGATRSRRSAPTGGLWALFGFGLAAFAPVAAAEGPDAGPHQHVDDGAARVFLTEDELVSALLPRSPALEAAAARLQARKSGEAAADTRPDAMIEVGVQNLPGQTLRLADEAMGGVMIGASAPIEPPGSLEARRRLAAAASGTAAAEQALAAFLEDRALRRAYWTVVARAIEAEHLRDQLALLDELTPLIEARYAAGAEPATALPSLRLARAALNDEAAAREAEALAETAPLQARLGGPLRLALPHALPLRAPPPGPIGCAAPAAIDPMIDVLEAIFEQEQAAAVEAKRSGRPDLRLSAGVMRRVMGDHSADGMSPTLLTVGAAVPLTFGAERRARAEAGAALHRAAAAEAEQRARVEAACARIAAGGLRWAEAAARAARIEGEQLPAARELEGLAWSRYRAGGAALEGPLRAAADRHMIERALHEARLEAILWSIDLLGLQAAPAP